MSAAESGKKARVRETLFQASAAADDEIALEDQADAFQALRLAVNQARGHVPEVLEELAAEAPSVLRLLSTIYKKKKVLRNQVKDLIQKLVQTAAWQNAANNNETVRTEILSAESLCTLVKSDTKGTGGNDTKSKGGRNAENKTGHAPPRRMSAPSMLDAKTSLFAVTQSATLPPGPQLVDASGIESAPIMQVIGKKAEAHEVSPPLGVICKKVEAHEASPPLGCPGSAVVEMCRAAVARAQSDNTSSKYKPVEKTARHINILSFNTLVWCPCAQQTASQDDGLKYASITAGERCPQQFMNNFCKARLHALRSMECNDMSTKNVAADLERDCLKQCYSAKMMRDICVVNIAVWRRSAIYVLFVASLTYAILSVSTINGAQESLRDLKTRSAFVVDYEQWVGVAHARLPQVPCTDIDAAFSQFLKNSLPVLADMPNSGMELMASAPSSCDELRSRGADCDLLSDAGVSAHVISFDRGTLCGWPSICGKPLHEVCPAACDASADGFCADTRSEAQPSYLRFSKEFFMALACNLRAQAKELELIKVAIRSVMNFATVALVVCAALCWTYFRKSRRILFVAWFVAFLGPFLTSLIPARLYVSWNEIDQDLLEFTVLTKKHFNIDQRMAEMLGTAADICNQRVPDLKQDYEYVKVKVQELCNLMSRLDVPFTGVDNSGREVCGQLRGGLLENVDTGVELTLKACDAFNRMWQSSSQDGLQSQMYEVIVDGVSKAKLVIEMTIGLSNALTSFKDIWATAISLAPGLINAALRMKILMPQASVPGIFIVLLPWLHAPLSWALYNCFFQLFGDWLLFCALLLFAFYPILYSILGWHYGVTAAMDERTANYVITRLKRAAGAINLTSIILLLIALLKVITKEDSEHMDGLITESIHESVRDAVKDPLTQSRGLVVITLIASVLTKYYMTSVVAFDWMLNEVARQRRFENLGKDRSALEGMVEGDVNMWKAAKFVKERAEHLDALVDLSELSAKKGTK